LPPIPPYSFIPYSFIPSFFLHSIPSLLPRSAESANLPIGSGEIESSNSTFVQERLKVSGPWWLPSNAADMLELRVLRANDDWEDYWKKKG
nr:hypothetical protein [Endozoicomonas sp.]